MLKLEKVAKSRELSVILRNKPTAPSKTFLVALSYALFCHLMALIFFQVAPFKISYQANILPPIFVESLSFHAVNIDCEENKLVPEYLIAPKSEPVSPSSWPKIVATPIVGLSEQMSMVPLSHFQHDLETIFFEAKKLPPLTWHFSGNLSAAKIDFDEEKAHDLLKQFMRQFPQLKKSEPYNLQFSVQIDGHKGEIFWWETLKYPEQMLYPLVEALLKIFKISTVDPFLSGIIELTINTNYD